MLHKKYHALFLGWPQNQSTISQPQGALFEGLIIAPPTPAHDKCKRQKAITIRDAHLGDAGAHPQKTYLL